MGSMKIDLSSGRLLGLTQAEIDRRIALARGTMVELGLDALLVIDVARDGYRRWLTGVSGPERQSEGGVIVSSEGPILSVMGGRLIDEGDRNEKPVGAAIRGGDSFFEGIRESQGFDAADILEMTGRSAGLRIGVVHGDAMRADLLDYLRDRIPGLEMSDATLALAEAKAVKSPEELGFARRAARMHRRVLESASTAIREGALEREIANDLRHAAYKLGCGGPDRAASAVLKLVSNRDGGDEEPGEPIYPGRRVSAGDRVSVRMSAVGESDFYSALGRCWVLGEPLPETRRLWALAVAAQDFAASLLVPGETIAEVAARTNEFLTANGCERDEGAFIHGIGYVPDESPRLHDASEDMRLRPGMVLAVEPEIRAGKLDPFCCADVFFLTEDGARRLEPCPRELIVL